MSMLYPDGGGTLPRDKIACSNVLSVLPTCSSSSSQNPCPAVPEKNLSVTRSVTGGASRKHDVSVRAKVGGPEIFKTKVVLCFLWTTIIIVQ